jgi:hypothetical protein
MLHNYNKYKWLLSAVPHAYTTTQPGQRSIGTARTDVQANTADWPTKARSRHGAYIAAARS